METEILAYQRQRSLFSRLETVANNVANANTAGFKKDLRVYLEVKGENKADSRAPEQISTITQSQSGFQKTGRKLDAAINGEGYFQVETPLGARYTRAGSFLVDTEGSLVTKEGYAVTGDGGAIAFAPEDSDFEIGDNGEVYAFNGTSRELKGTLAVVNFEDKSSMQKVGNTYFKSDEAPAPAIPVEEFKIVQGALEMSNVNSVTEITEMIDISRAVQQVSKIISDQHSIARNTFNKIAGSGS